jgi:N utilization substance protein B
MPSRAHTEARLARSAARLAAVQALYQMELTGTPWEAVREEFEAHRLGAEIEGAQYREADIDFFREILEGVVADQAWIDQLTDRALVAKWPLGRIDATLRALFRAAGYEITARPDIPPRVTIGEYVDVAKAFFAEGKEAKFVNAVLDHMARESRAEQMEPR